MKTQMKYQKILALASLIFAALTIVYSFFFTGGMLYEIQAYAVPQFNVGGADELNAFVQKGNNILVIMSIVLILCVVFVYLTNTNKRRNYYVTNYIAIGLLLAVTLACFITFIVIISKTFALCGAVDVDAWYELYIAERRGGRVNPQHYSTNKSTLILGIFVAVLMLVMVAAWVLNTLWKVKLMRGEKALLQGNEVKEAA